MNDDDDIQHAYQTRSVRKSTLTAKKIFSHILFCLAEMDERRQILESTFAEQSNLTNVTARMGTLAHSMQMSQVYSYEKQEMCFWIFFITNFFFF